MRFYIPLFLSALLVDHSAAFSRNHLKSQYRTLTSRLQADYLKNLESYSGFQSSSNSDYSFNYDYSTSSPSQNPSPSYPDDGTSASVTNSNGNQDFSYLQDWSAQGNTKGSYLNQLSGSSNSVPGPTSRYLDNPVSSGGTGVVSYTDSLSSTPTTNELFFAEQKGATTFPSQSFNSNEEKMDPFSGFPISAYNQYPPSQPGDDWQREMVYLKETVHQLSNNLSSFSSQLASVLSAQTTPSPLPTMVEIEEKLKAQFDKVMEAQTGVTKQLEASIADVRASLSKQEQSIQQISQKGQDQSQRVTNLSQTVTTMQTSVQFNQANQQKNEERLKALENRLAEQEKELRNASTGTDPQIVAIEAKLQEQSELLKHAMANPESRLAALETKIGKLQQEILAASNKPESRVAALEAKMKEQSARLEVAASQPDPRIAILEAKMKVQEEQIRAATEAITDARISALRAKLIQQQEQFEAANKARKTIPIPPSYPPTTPTPFPWENPFDTTRDETTKEEVTKDEVSKAASNKSSSSKWLPWGQPWKGPKSTSKDQTNKESSATPPEPIPQPGFSAALGTPLGASLGSETSLNRQTNNPPPAFGSYQNTPTTTNFSGLNGAFQGLPFGKSQGITIETGQPRPPTNASPPPPTTPPTALGSLRPISPIDSVGSFQGSAFGRNNGISIETPGQQRSRISTPRAGPKPSTTANRNPLTTGRFSPPPPVVKSDQDLWDPDRPNPDTVKRPLIEYPKSPRESNDIYALEPPIVPSDQARWDPDRPNPDAVKRPLIELPKASTQDRRLAKISSDQDQWDPDKPNPDAVKRPLIESKPMRKESSPQLEVRPPYWSNAASRDPSRGSSGAEAQRDDHDFPLAEPINGSLPGTARGVPSDQGRWDSAAQVKRDIDDMRAATATPPKVRPPPSSPFPSMEESNLYRKSKLLSAYLEWCQSYGREPSEARFELFSQNYAKMEAIAQQTGRFPALNAFADYSEDEFARKNAAGGRPIT